MKKILQLLFFIGLSALASCGEKGSLDMDGGSGKIWYDSKTYDVNISTIITSGPDSDGLFSHHVSFVSSATGNFFAFEITNESSSSDISTGEYVVTKEDNKASFSVKPDGVASVTGRPTGIMSVSKSGQSHNFDFEGSDTEADPHSATPKSVRFEFKGKLVKTNI